MLDTFDFRAYGVPVLLATSPLIAALQATVISLGGSWHWLQLLPIPLWLVCGAVVIQLGHTPGKKLEPQLWQSWGGPPTTRLLRWRGASNPEQTADTHAAIDHIVGPNLRLPTETEEQQDPAKADLVYETVVGRLIALTSRADDYPKLKNHLVWYCLRRSLLGLRKPALVISGTTCLFAIASGAAIAVFAPASNGLVAAFVTTGVSVLVFFGFKVIVSQDFVREAAQRYAEELIKLAYAL